MKKLRATYQIAVTDAFLALQQAVFDLFEPLCLHDTRYPFWFQPPPEFGNFQNTEATREHIFDLINRFEYYDGQDPRGILVGPGLVAAGPETIACLHALNDKKLAFKQAMIELKKHNIQLSEQSFNQEFESFLSTIAKPDHIPFTITRPGTVQNSLNKLGFARLHLKQCYRLIPILDCAPVKIAYTWANTRAITRIDVAQAEQSLLRRKNHNNPAITAQLYKISKLPKNTPLAIVQELAPHLRTNILYPDDHEPLRQMLKGAMPIFYPADNPFMPLPDIKPPKTKTSKHPTRPQRTDTKLESVPFLPSLRAHRYLEFLEAPV